ncbi:hypothetical protein ACWDKQ_31960, partial [Saccharopolyspora sp. NPDC000995]
MEKETSSGSGHAVLGAPFFAAGVSHPEGAKTYEEGRHEFGQVGDWNIPLISRGGHESETEHQAGSESEREAIPSQGADSPLQDITSTWLHGVEFRMVATAGEHSIGKRRAGVSATFEAGYVIRRGDRGGQLPAGLVAATRQFAERDRQWAAAIDRQRAAGFQLSQATQAEARAEGGQRLAAADRRERAQQAWDEADTHARDAEGKWWQAKRHYETELAHARTDPALAGAQSDASLTLGKDPRTRLHNRLGLYPVARKAVDATREGRRPRARYVVRGNLDRMANGKSQAGQDFHFVAQGLNHMLDLAQHDLPPQSRLGAGDLGLITAPQFLHAEGPTRVDIWIEPGPVLRDPDDQQLAEELSRNPAQELLTARRTSMRPSPKPDTAKVRTPGNGPAKSADWAGPSHTTAKRGLEPIQEEQEEPDGARRRLFWTDERGASQIDATATDSTVDGDPVRDALTSDYEHALKDPEVEPERPVAGSTSADRAAEAAQRIAAKLARAEQMTSEQPEEPTPQEQPNKDQTKVVRLGQELEPGREYSADRLRALRVLRSLVADREAVEEDAVTAEQVREFVTSQPGTDDPGALLYRIQTARDLLNEVSDINQLENRRRHYTAAVAEISTLLGIRELNRNAVIEIAMKIARGLGVLRPDSRTSSDQSHAVDRGDGREPLTSAAQIFDAARNLSSHYNDLKVAQRIVYETNLFDTPVDPDHVDLNGEVGVGFTYNTLSRLVAEQRANPDLRWNERRLKRFAAELGRVLRTENPRWVRRSELEKLGGGAGLGDVSHRHPVAPAQLDPAAQRTGDEHPARRTNNPVEAGPSTWSAAPQHAADYAVGAEPPQQREPVPGTPSAAPHGDLLATRTADERVAAPVSEDVTGAPPDRRYVASDARDVRALLRAATVVADLASAVVATIPSLVQPTEYGVNAWKEWVLDRGQVAREEFGPEFPRAGVAYRVSAVDGAGSRIVLDSHRLQSTAQAVSAPLTWTLNGMRQAAEYLVLAGQPWNAARQDAVRARVRETYQHVRLPVASRHFLAALESADRDAITAIVTDVLYGTKEAATMLVATPELRSYSWRSAVSLLDAIATNLRANRPVDLGAIAPQPTPRWTLEGLRQAARLVGAAERRWGSSQAGLGFDLRVARQRVVEYVADRMEMQASGAFLRDLSDQDAAGLLDVVAYLTISPSLPNGVAEFIRQEGQGGAAELLEESNVSAGVLLDGIIADLLSPQPTSAPPVPVSVDGEISGQQLVENVVGGDGARRDLRNGPRNLESGFDRPDFPADVLANWLADTSSAYSAPEPGLETTVPPVAETVTEQLGGPAVPASDPRRLREHVRGWAEARAAFLDGVAALGWSDRRVVPEWLSGDPAGARGVLARVAGAVAGPVHAVVVRVPRGTDWVGTVGGAWYVRGEELTGGFPAAFEDADSDYFGFAVGQDGKVDLPAVRGFVDQEPRAVDGTGEPRQPETAPEALPVNRDAADVPGGGGVITRQQLMENVVGGREARRDFRLALRERGMLPAEPEPAFFSDDPNIAKALLTSLANAGGAFVVAVVARLPKTGASGWDGQAWQLSVDQVRDSEFPGNFEHAASNYFLYAVGHDETAVTGVSPLRSLEGDPGVTSVMSEPRVGGSGPEEATGEWSGWPETPGPRLRWDRDLVLGMAARLSAGDQSEREPKNAVLSDAVRAAYERFDEPTESLAKRGLETRKFLGRRGLAEGVEVIAAHAWKGRAEVWSFLPPALPRDLNAFVQAMANVVAQDVEWSMENPVAAAGAGADDGGVKRELAIRRTVGQILSGLGEVAWKFTDLDSLAPDVRRERTTQVVAARQAVRDRIDPAALVEHGLTAEQVALAVADRVDPSRAEESAGEAAQRLAQALSVGSPESGQTEALAGDGRGVEPEPPGAVAAPRDAWDGVEESSPDARDLGGMDPDEVLDRETSLRDWLESSVATPGTDAASMAVASSRPRQGGQGLAMDLRRPAEGWTAEFVLQKANEWAGQFADGVWARVVGLVRDAAPGSLGGREWADTPVGAGVAWIVASWMSRIDSPLSDAARSYADELVGEIVTDLLKLPNPAVVTRDKFSREEALRWVAVNDGFASQVAGLAHHAGGLRHHGDYFFGCVLATAAAYNSRKRGELYSFGPTTQREFKEQDVVEAFKIDRFVRYDKAGLLRRLGWLPYQYSGLILIENSENPREGHLIEVRRTPRGRLDIMDRMTGLPAELPDGPRGQYTFKLGRIVESELTDGLVELDGLQPASAGRPDPRQLVREAGEGMRDEVRPSYRQTLKAILNEISLTRLASLGMDVDQVGRTIERRVYAQGASQVRPTIDEIVRDVARDLKVVKHRSPNLPEPMDMPINNEARDLAAAAGTAPQRYGIELFEKMHADRQRGYTVHVLADGTVATRTYRVVAAGAAEQAANTVGEQVRSGFAYARAVYLAGWPNPEELPAETDIDVVTEVTEPGVLPSPGTDPATARVRISVQEDFRATPPEMQAGPQVWTVEDVKALAGNGWEISPELRSVARMVFAEFSLMRLQVMNLHPFLVAEAALRRHSGNIRDGFAVRATVEKMAYDLQARKADVVAEYSPKTVTFPEGDAELTGKDADTAHRVGMAWFDRAAFVDHRERDGSDETGSARSGEGPVSGGAGWNPPRIVLHTYDNTRRGGRSGGQIKADQVVALIREAVDNARRMLLEIGLPPTDVPHPWDVPVTVISTQAAPLPDPSLGLQRRQVKIVLGESTRRPESGQISTWLNDHPDELLSTNELRNLSPDEPRTEREQVFPRLPDDPRPKVNTKHKLLVALNPQRFGPGGFGPGVGREIHENIRDALEFQTFFHGRDASPFTDFEPVRGSGIEALGRIIERVRGAGPGALSFLVGYRRPFWGRVWVLVNLGRDDEGDLVYIVDPSSGDKFRVRNLERVALKKTVDVVEDRAMVQHEVWGYAVRSVTVTDLVAEPEEGYRGGAGGKEADDHDRPVRWVLKERRWEIKESRQHRDEPRMRIEKISETKSVTTQLPHGMGNPVTREKWPEGSLPGLWSTYEIALDARENPVDVSEPPMYGHITHTPVTPSRFGWETVMAEGGVEALRAFESHTGKSADLITRYTPETFGTGGDGVRQVLERTIVAKGRDPRNRDAFTVMVVRGIEEPRPEAEADIVRRDKLPGVTLARAYVVRFDGDELTIVDPRTGVVVSPADFGYAGVIEAVPVDADGEYVSPPEEPGDAGDSGVRVGGGQVDVPRTEGDSGRAFGQGFSHEDAEDAEGSEVSGEDSVGVPEGKGKRAEPTTPGTATSEEDAARERPVSAADAHGDFSRSASTTGYGQAFKEPEGPVVLPAGGSELRRKDWGAGLTEVTGPKGQTRVGLVAGASAKRTLQEAGESSFRGATRRKVEETTAAGFESGSQGGEGDRSAPTDQATQQYPYEAVKQKWRKDSQTYRAARTPAGLRKVESGMGGMEAAERKLHNVGKAKVREVYAQAIGQGRVPVAYFKDGVPGGVSSRPDVRLGFEVEFKLPGDDFDARVDSLGAALDREGLVDWKAQGSQLTGKEAAKAIAASGRWALIKEGPAFEVEATSPILRNDRHGTVWSSMEKLLDAVARHGGYGSESGGHINVSFDPESTDWPWAPVQYLRLAQVVKVFEALIFRLGNVAGGDVSKQRDVRHAAPLPLPPDPYTVDETGGKAASYEPVLHLNVDKDEVVRFGVSGREDDRLEFRVWAGDAGELTGNPALWQVRAELSAAIMLAGTDPGIYRELDRLMGDPDLLGYDDQTRDEEVWLEKLAEFLELLPLSEAGQAQVVQLFAWTRPWKSTGDTVDYLTQTVSMPHESVLFPTPHASKAQVVAEAYSYQLYKKASLVVARLGPDGDSILLRNNVVDFVTFAGLLEMRHAGWLRDEWTVLAIPGGARHGELLELVLDIVEGPVLATLEDLYKTPDGRLFTGVYETDQIGRVQFRPSNGGWREFTRGNWLGRLTFKSDLGEALMDSRTRLLPDDPAEDYRYWPARAVPLPARLPVDAVPVAVPAEVVSRGGGLAGFVGELAGSTGGPVVLVSQVDPGVGVVVSPDQGSDLARGLGRVVVALTPGSVGGTPQWTVFAADGSARPVTGSDAGVLAGGRGGLAGLAEASGGVPVGVPVGTAASGTAPVGQWSDSDVRGEIERARQLELTPGEMDAAWRIVQGTHDPRKLAGRGAAVSLDEVVALVADKYREPGSDHRGQVVAFSRELAERLGTKGSGLGIQAGAGPAPAPAPGAGAEVEGEVVLPPSGSRWRGQDWESGLPTVVTGPKRRGGVSGPGAGKAGAKDTKRTRGKADQDSREEAGESSRGVKRRKVDTAAAAGAVSGSPGDGERGELTPTDQAAQQDPRAEQKRKQKERNAKNYQERKAAAARVAELEALQEQGPLTGEQEAELAELRPKAQTWQKQKDSVAKYKRTGKAAAARVAELEALQEQGPLTDEQEAELAELQPKVAQPKQKQKESVAKYRSAVKAAVARVAVLEGLKERGQLTKGQEAELAELRTKAQAWQKKKEGAADWYQAAKAAAARVEVLEGLREQGPLTDEQEAELAELRTKAQQWQKHQKRHADWYQAAKDVAARVEVLEGLRERGPLSEKQEAELAELQPKVAQQKQKRKESVAKYRRAVKAAAARVEVLEGLRERGPLSEEQEAELAGLRSKVAGRGRKKASEVMETGVGGPAVVGRGTGPEGVPGWTGTDQDGRDAWSADADLDAWLARAVADVDGVPLPQDAADAGMLLGEGAYEELVATELLAFLGQDAGNDAAGAGGAGPVAGDEDFAAFLDEYGGDPLGLFGVGADELDFGEPVVDEDVSPRRVEGGGLVAGAEVLRVSDPVAGNGSVGSGYRFLRGVNQANYRR